MDLAGITVLIVDDDPIIAHDLEVAISEKGYSIGGVAHTYDQALEDLERTPIDLAILDINLEDKNQELTLPITFYRKRIFLLYILPVIRMNTPSLSHRKQHHMVI